MAIDYSEDKKPLKGQLKDEIRQRIIDAGVRAFSELGFHGMKIAAVARDAGVANGTYYLHFKDKKALYNEIARLATAKLASSIFAAHNYNGGQGNSDRAEIEAVIEFAEQNKDYLRIALNTAAPDSSDKSDLFKPLIDIRMTELKKGIKDGHINHGIHPEIGARAEIGMLLSVVHWWLANRNKASKEQLLNTLLHLRRSWALTDANVDDIDSLLSQWDSRL